MVVPAVALALAGSLLAGCDATASAPATHARTTRSTHHATSRPASSHRPTSTRPSANSPASSPASGTPTASGSAASTAVRAAQNLALGWSVPTAAASRGQLAALRVADAGSLDGYSRELFPHWRDASTWGWPVAPSNRCNSRNAALYRDGTNVRVSATCAIISGRWLDPYTARLHTRKGTMDIDHLVPLAAAWRAGASGWTPTRRIQYANDPLELVSADDRTNESKGDKTPDAWKPPNHAAWCLYAQRWTAVKTKYSLSVTSSEKSALATMLATCTA